MRRRKSKFSTAETIDTRIQRTESQVPKAVVRRGTLTPYTCVWIICIVFCRSSRHTLWLSFRPLSVSFWKNCQASEHTLLATSAGVLYQKNETQGPLWIKSGWFWENHVGDRGYKVTLFGGDCSNSRQNSSWIWWAVFLDQYLVVILTGQSTTSIRLFCKIEQSFKKTHFALLP